MKVRWREHEIILVTMAAVVLLAGHLWKIFHLSAVQVDSIYAAPFTINRVPFNLYRNVVLPDIGVGLLTYLSYLLITLFSIPRLLSKKEIGFTNSKIAVRKIFNRGSGYRPLRIFLWLLIQTVLLTLLLGTAFNVAAYLNNEYYFNYPGFTFFPKFGNHPETLLDIKAGFRLAFILIVAYTVYACTREVIIHFIETSGSRAAFRILITNQLTIFLVVCTFIPLFAAVFHLVHDGKIISGYYSYVVPLFLSFMYNTYWLFPLTERKRFFSSDIILRLLISTFLCTLPIVLSPFHEGLANSFLTCWIISLFIVTPVSWILYQQRKDKLLQLLGSEKALIKSKADLQFLRSQINPHFLFNVLNTLYGTALLENAEHTAGGIQKLGDMMRFILNENNLDFINMGQEINYLKNYISLQKLRTHSSPSIIIEDNIHEQNCHHKIAPMLLIPLVENAFKHGISLNKRSWIKISLFCTQKEIRFEVRNSIHLQPGNDPERERSGIGLKNVQERLKLIYPGNYKIIINKDEKEFIVQLTLQP